MLIMRPINDFIRIAFVYAKKIMSSELNLFMSSELRLFMSELKEKLFISKQTEFREKIHF